MKTIGAILAIFITAAACASLSGTGSSTTNPSTNTGYNYASTPTKQAAPAAPTLTPGTIPSGEWLVGTEVVPGLYRSAGPDEGFITYCQVTTEDANGHVLEWKNSGTVGEGLMVRVSPKAKTVHNSGCASFTKVG